MTNRPCDISAVTVGQLNRDDTTCQPLPYDISTVRPYDISAVGLDISTVTIRHFAVGLTAEMPSKVRYSGLIFKAGCFQVGCFQARQRRYDFADMTHRLVASLRDADWFLAVAACCKDKDKTYVGVRP